MMAFSAYIQIFWEHKILPHVIIPVNAPMKHAIVNLERNAYARIKPARMKNKSNKILIIVLIAIQIFVFIYFAISINNTNNYITETRQDINNKISDTNNKLDSAKQELQNNVNELSNSLISTQKSLTETQSSFEKQISSIKAQTSADFSGIIENAVKGVVSIKTNVAQGTGFIITDDGYLVTNAHVMEGATNAAAITSDQEMKTLTLIGYNNEMDIALLKISGNYDSLKFDDSDNVKIGEKVIAIGNPLGLSFSVTEGIVSAVNRRVRGSSGEYIQTDTALNPGNSGGPLINTDGKVIGINNFKIAGDNIGFALESNYIVDEVNKIAMDEFGETLI
jgi:S1-C subfamily serine protease